MNCYITCLYLSNHPKILSILLATKLVGLVTHNIKIQETFSVCYMLFWPEGKMIADSFNQ